MKRIILLAALLLSAGACAAPSTAPNNASTTPANGNTTVAVATPTPAVMVSDADIIAKEKQVWDMIKNQNLEGFGSMLAEDEMYVSDDNIYDKKGTLDGLKGLELTDVTLSDWKVVKIDKDAAVVTYSISVKGKSQGREMPADSMSRDATAWVNRDGKWLAVYHQDTMVKKAAPAAAGNSNKPASPNASPAATPAATTAADPTSREKQIWEGFKNKNFDILASALADDAIEIEPDGVYDKAGSINGVKQVDFTNVALSDFKEVKLDSDASLVTYVVKGSAPAFSPEGERHSSIWANRDGKWMAVFHQGTPIAKAHK